MRCSVYVCVTPRKEAAVVSLQASVDKAPHQAEAAAAAEAQADPRGHAMLCPPAPRKKSMDAQSPTVTLQAAVDEAPQVEAAAAAAAAAEADLGYASSCPPTPRKGAMVAQQRPISPRREVNNSSTRAGTPPLVFRHLAEFEE